MRVDTYQNKGDLNLNSERRKEVARILSEYRSERINLQEALEKLDEAYGKVKRSGKEIWKAIKTRGVQT